ncbi:hypothetical protein [Poseidonibacter ostreae]|uniref:Uncharacterized protein n=1 Tax=Poseidonibacter ostreae TaxID=2654171 RepID=A0ABQ6VLE0_9BACT|nr:hypothetical protein [Poseidonibacter ostreae]KAB7889729.1 hypothetical protein GBG18_10535 [Poseidonibacter ostreae]
MKKKITTPEKIKAYKEKMDELSKTDYELTDEQIKLIVDFIEVLRAKNNGLIFEGFFDENEKAIHKFNAILTFCLQSSINMQGTLDILINCDIAFIKCIRKLFISKDLINLKETHLEEITIEYERDLRKELLIRIEELSEYGNRIQLNKYSNLYQEILNNSYEETIKRINNKINDIHLPFNQYKIDQSEVIQNLEHEKNTFNDLITNNMKRSKLIGNNHFLSHLVNDDIEITDDYNIVFKGHTESLVIGYTSKAILLSIDKNIVIRELKTKIKILTDFRQEESDILIEYSKTLIEFAQTKRYANYIPFKIIAKRMNLTKNVAKNYAKALIQINEKSFKDRFDELNTLEF